MYDVTTSPKGISNPEEEVRWPSPGGAPRMEDCPWTSSAVCLANGLWVVVYFAVPCTRNGIGPALSDCAKGATGASPGAKGRISGRGYNGALALPSACSAPSRSATSARGRAIASEAVTGG